MISRRNFLHASVLGAAGLLLSRRAVAELAPKPIAITVYKTPTCGCCKEWVAHLSKNGFAPVVHDLPDLAETKTTLGVPDALQSCHTGVIGRYFIEGHVPADVIRKLVTENSPNIVGLAVPGMPAGSPGMEMGGRKDRYDVFAVLRDGKRTVYAQR
jgi:hypothetical protein